MGKIVTCLGVAVAFGAGAWLGNFYYLIVHRLPGGRYRVALPPSCPACGRAERRIWMLPVLWYFILRGRCPACGFAYRRQLLYLELASGAVTALLFYYYGFSLPFATTFAFCCFFFLNYVVDFRFGVVIPQLYVPAAAVGFAASFLPGDPSPLASLAGGLVGGGGLLLTSPFRAEASSADRAAQRQLALITLVGLYLGWQSALLVLAVAAAAAAVVPLAGRRFFKREAENVFGLAVFAAALITAFYHNDITSWYLKIR